MGCPPGLHVAVEVGMVVVVVVVYRVPVYDTHLEYHILYIRIQILHIVAKVMKRAQAAHQRSAGKRACQTRKREREIECERKW